MGNLIGDLFRQKTASVLLLGYTIYSDTYFAFLSVLAQLFTQTVRPTTMEYSLYSLAGSLLSIVFPLLWLWGNKWVKIRLRSWLIVGYSLALITPFWGSIGISSKVGVGFKVGYSVHACLCDWLRRFSASLGVLYHARGPRIGKLDHQPCLPGRLL